MLIKLARLALLMVLALAVLPMPASGQGPPPNPQGNPRDRQPRGPQQPPPDLTPEMVNQPYNGPGTVTYDPAELELVRRTGMPSPELLARARSEEHTSELQSQSNLVCRLLLEKKKNKTTV